MRSAGSTYFVAGGMVVEVGAGMVRRLRPRLERLGQVTLYQKRPAALFTTTGVLNQCAYFGIDGRRCAVDGI